MSMISTNLIQDKQIRETSNTIQQIQQNNSMILNSSMSPLDDPQYLVQNAQCFQQIREFSNKSFKKKSKKNEKFQFTNQFIYGCFIPPYYSVLNCSLMEKFVMHLHNPNAPISKLLMAHKEIIEHEQEFFKQWLSTLWEENLKNRRLTVIPHIEQYIKSACNFSNDYIKSYYNGSYRSKMKIDYNRDEYELTSENLDSPQCGNTFEMIHSKRIKSSVLKYTVELPVIDITNIESKLSFTDDVYNPPQKLPFVKDEFCQTLSKEYSSDVNICLSSIKHIMNLEKPNSLWIIPVDVDIDADMRKTIYIGGALSTGHFSQQEKSSYYLRKEIKRKFRKLCTTSDNGTIENHSKYNYDNWILNYVHKDIDDVIKSFNLLVRNKPHVIHGTKKSNNQSIEVEKVLIPKVEYQPEFGFEKICDEQLIEIWLDTYFRTPNCQMISVSVQYNMDIMMIKQKNVESSVNFDKKKQVYLQRLYLTLDKLSQLDKGEYVMLHNPKKPFQVELYQSSIYGGFNLLNMYFVLQQSEVSESLTWNPIDATVICPIHEHFKVAPCMFRPNVETINISEINDQVNKFKTVIENKEKFEKEKLENRKRIKKEKNKIKRQLKRANEV